MNKLALSALALLIGTGAASAADLAARPYTKAPPAVVAPIYNWTGFYIGGSVGGTWNDSRADISPSGCFLTSATCGGGPALNPLRSDSTRFGQARFIGGGQAGYNWQSGIFVGGIEGDISWTGLNEGIITAKAVAAPLVGIMNHTDSIKEDWLATVRGRLGMTVAPSFLIYATGGLAVGHVQSASAVSFTTTPDTYAGNYDATRVGWTVGGGGEWMFAPNWSVKAEYLYVDLGKASYTQACTVAAVCGSPPQVAPGASYQTDVRFHENIARVGVNYHFGGPVVAKY